ncbi:MAG: hypothetical protein MK132_00015 [Lentisphaerales bacterium]|nr:hypothetical protein [Lentisphaerales bacterium]
MEKILTYEEWTTQMQAHRQRIEDLTKPWRKAKERSAKHPVIDFLFRYFSFPYKRLISWTPGFGVSLEGEFHKDLSDHRFEQKGGIIKLKEELIPKHRIKALDWTISLLEKTMSNTTCFNCYGLHEWAMVYKAQEVRHNNNPLRLSQDEISAIIEEKQLVCTHYDALRFYTPEAVPLNKHQPTRETQEVYEQSACLHANMDLYKWSYKMYPWISSDLMLRCFELAMDCRRIDMKASPYDLKHLGYEPIYIETAEGREIYVKEQLRLKQAGEPLRQELFDVYKGLKSYITSRHLES